MAGLRGGEEYPGQLPGVGGTVPTLDPGFRAVPKIVA